MSDRDIAIKFNDAINARDLDALVALMTDDHRFIDTGGTVFEGIDRCREIWTGFFSAFPDYRNHFETVEAREGAIVIAGRSTCSDARLAGPALWSVIVVDGAVREWRVHEDTPERRLDLGLAT
jgi:ketosteroid isomerase-like protein